MVRVLRSHRRGRWFEPNHIHHLFLLTDWLFLILFCACVSFYEGFLMNTQMRLTTLQQEQLLGEKVENIVRYDFSDQQACPAFYNRAHIFLGRGFQRYAQDAVFALQKDKRFVPIMCAVKTVSQRGIPTIWKDRVFNVNAPYANNGQYVLGNLIVWDALQQKYRTNPRGWVYVSEHACAEAAAEESLYDFVIFLRTFAQDVMLQYEK